MSTVCVHAVTNGQETFNRGEQREESTRRQTARLRDLTPSRHANPSNTSYLLCPVSPASKGGKAIRCSYIMKKKPIRTKWGFSFSHQRVVGTVVVEYVQYECEIVAAVILLYGQVLLSCQLLSVYKRKDEGNIMIKKKKNTLFFCLAVCRAEQRFLDGEQNCAPVFWHWSVTRADRETESVGAEGATFIWCEKHCWSDTFNGNFLTLCCHLK